MAYESNWTQIIFVFRVTTIPMFVLITVWLTAMIFPHVKIPLAKRRYMKEFCWALLGNFLALEIVLFIFLSSAIGLEGHIGIEVGGRVFSGMIPSFFLTLLATWQYRKIDPANRQSAIKFGLITVIEHGLIYLISYFLILMIVGSSFFALE